jgi:hypothetical protein
MSSIHIVAVEISIVILIIGSYGFLRKKWNFWLFFVFCWFAENLFGFGILPTQFPEWSLLRQVNFSILLSIVSFIVIGSLMKYILVRKGK